MSIVTFLKILWINTRKIIDNIDKKYQEVSDLTIEIVEIYYVLPGVDYCIAISSHPVYNGLAI